MNLPKINIKYNRFLDPIFKVYIKSNPKWKDWVEPTEAEVKERVKKYKEEWGKYEKIIISEICKVLGLNFKRNIIDVHIVSGNDRQFSHPIVIKSGFNPDEFVDILTHELLHVLFQDNINIFPISILEDMFPGESKTTKNHIVTYAVLKFLYLDILCDNSKLERNILNSKKHSNSDYTRAWEIVDKKGYQEIIDSFKKKLVS